MKLREAPLRMTISINPLISIHYFRSSYVDTFWSARPYFSLEYSAFAAVKMGMS